LRVATNGDDVDAMTCALRHSRSHHSRLVGALGGSQLPRELAHRVETSTHECESRKALVSSAIRRMNAAWRAGHPAEVSASIAAAISLSLPRSSGPVPAEVADNASMQTGQQGSLASKAQELEGKLAGLVEVKHLLNESCQRLDRGIPMDATTLDRNIQLISECSKFEATASSPKLRRLQSAVAEMYAMAEEGIGKENLQEEKAGSGVNRRGGASGLLSAPTAMETQARTKLETKALLAQRRVETRTADVATRRASAREARVHVVEAQLAQNRSTIQQHQQELRASIASKEDKALQNQLALSKERAQRMERYVARGSKAAAVKGDLEAEATAKLLVAQAALEQRYVLRSTEADSRERDGVEQRRLAQQRRDSVAQRRESLESERRSRLEAKLSSTAPVVDPDSGSPDPTAGNSEIGAKGTAAFLSTTRTQRESAVVSYSGGTSRDNNPRFYTKPVSAAIAADPNAVWRETAFPYPEPKSLAPVKQRRQVVGRWISKT
jgi:hypothetical protein